MRQIYLLALEADAQAADGIETMLKQRGYMVRRAEEKFAFPPARSQEITLALWSRAAQMSVKQILFTNRAIDAWSEGRLILAKLDHAQQPRGLGDVATIDMSFAPGRIASISKVVATAQEIDRITLESRREASADPDDGGSAGGAGFQDIVEDTESPGAPERWARKPADFSSELAVIVGLVAAAALGSLGFLVMPFSSNTLVGVAAVAWGAVAGTCAGFLAGRGRLETVSAPPVSVGEGGESPSRQEESAQDADFALEEASERTQAPVFVSYSRRDGEVVYPMVAEVEAAGREVWIDRDEIQAGVSWAGTIVRAIRASDTFCLMCSAEAFQSDNVRREIYIADKYKRKLLPVRLDFAEMPEDFEYFLIDRQWLDLTAVEPDERAVRLTAALSR